MLLRKLEVVNLSRDASMLTLWRHYAANNMYLRSYST